MPEEEPIKGNLWTKHAVELLSNLGWELKGDTNVDIPCTMHPFKRKGQSHGIDAFMTYFDPYQNIELGIIIETKNYAWKSINAPFIQESFNKLVEVLGCVPYSEEFNSKMNFNNAKVDTALLMVWAHDEFDKLKFEEYLKELQVPKRHKPLRVYIVNNYDILKLYSIVDTVKKITDALKQNEKFDIYYPSYLESDSLKGKNLVSLEYIFSKFIFGKLLKIKSNSEGYTSPNNITIVLYFDKLTLNCLTHMYLALRHFQLTEKEIHIFHYEDVINDRTDIKEFERQYLKDNEKKIEFKPMTSIKNVPWRVL